MQTLTNYDSWKTGSQTTVAQEQKARGLAERGASDAYFKAAREWGGHCCKCGLRGRNGSQTCPGSICGGRINPET